MPANDNYPIQNPNGDWWPEDAYGKPVCITEIANDMSPTVARNVAAYYRGKGERWADVVAGKVLASASAAANDNGKRKRIA